MRGLFVTGTDTDVGKTVVAAAVCAALRARGERVAAFKPVVTGLDEPTEPGLAARPRAACGGDGPARRRVVAARASGHRCRHTSRPTLAGERLEPAELVQAASRGGRGERRAGRRGRRRAARAARRATTSSATSPASSRSRSSSPPGLGLGTINHTLLTLESARRAGLNVAAVVLTPWPDEPGVVEASNRETLARLGDVEVATLARVARGAPELLAEAGSSLPLDRWLAAA